MWDSNQLKSSTKQKTDIQREKMTFRGPSDLNFTMTSSLDFQSANLLYTDLGFVSLHNCMSQILKINFFLFCHACVIHTHTHTHTHRGMHIQILFVPLLWRNIDNTRLITFYLVGLINHHCSPVTELFPLPQNLPCANPIESRHHLSHPTPITPNLWKS